MPARRLGTGHAVPATIGVLAVVAACGHFGPRHTMLVVAPAGAALLLLLGRPAGLSRTDLDIGPGSWGRGAAYAGAAVAAIAVVYAATAVLPATRDLDAAPTSRERAALAVRELQRTGAFDRKVLCVITTTGTGWVNEQAVEPLEFMYHGDTALVGLQYSYLPSWISFLVDKERARAAGRDLFDQVYRVWSRLPPGQRPKLLVFGAESAFSGVEDIQNRVDGMLLVGPPNRNELWRRYTAERDPGTREVLPTFEGGASVRFAADPSTDLDGPPGPWSRPRVVYLQHPSDPIVWWTPDLMLSRPNRLAERRGADVLPSTHWLPFVTFWQVTADLAFSNSGPAGHGHRYGTAPVAAWAAIAPPAGWTAARTADLTRTMTRPG
ncbi:alpha/beta-hydrolase family protein [Dactylosporangium sp. NBC_01737]|uniref:alpha/beta-hydrolase family protein n=1 Tax=Dactylosporangium sp. NBC_01737 TaxID=2975959 RepID=UPI002E0E50BD|nr:alpha/beta-hydrolase family protein [Dactylosporangium sp. NBC_01737]